MSTQLYCQLSQRINRPKGYVSTISPMGEDIILFWCITFIHCCIMCVIIGLRVSVDLICRGCELKISGIILTLDLRVMDMTEFDVILGMDWLTTQRVVIDCERRRVTAYIQDGTRVTFQGDKHNALPQAVYDSRWHGKLKGWLTSLTLEDEVRQDLDLPRVVCEYKDVFQDEPPELPSSRNVDFRIELHLGTSPISMAPHRMAPVELQELKV